MYCAGYTYAPQEQCNKSYETQVVVEITQGSPHSPTPVRYRFSSETPALKPRSNRRRQGSNIGGFFESEIGLITHPTTWLHQARLLE